MPDKRDSKRIPFRVMLDYGPEDPPTHRSFATDLSDTGVCIKTNKVFKPGIELYMNIEIGEKTYKAYGVIMWAKIVPPRLVRVVKNGMGVRFIYMDPGLLEEYNKKKEHLA